MTADVGSPASVLHQGGHDQPDAGQIVRGRASAWDVAASVPDPELPVVTLADLGILRSVEMLGDELVVTVTPTYSGCPAMREIRHDLTHQLRHAGYAHVEIRTALSPPWSSDWITTDGRAKLAVAGIAPPNPARRHHSGPIPLTLSVRAPIVACPRCGDTGTRRTSAFGATACRALYRCASCDEPFEYVKDI